MTNIQMLSNEQIAEAIGWRLVKDYKIGWLWKYKWQSPDKKFHKQLPDFDNDIKAWFDWVVPWLEENERLINLDFVHSDDNKTWNIALFFHGRKYVSGNGKSPSIAFKKAFTELVKG